MDEPINMPRLAAKYAWLVAVLEKAKAPISLIDKHKKVAKLIKNAAASGDPKWSYSDAMREAEQIVDQKYRWLRKGLGELKILDALNPPKFPN
ncbi:MAG: hypothetical protein ACLP4V_25475 [Methylocella sp.]